MEYVTNTVMRGRNDVCYNCTVTWWGVMKYVTTVYSNVVGRNEVCYN